MGLFAWKVGSMNSN